jgi:formate hydrogenlyase transcriptional activator
VQERKFRADLYYRLNVFPINLPPLREREDDVRLLVEHFVRKFAERQGKSIDRIPDEVVEVLKHYHWPGNIRELQNFIERAVIMTTGRCVAPGYGGPQDRRLYIPDDGRDSGGRRARSHHRDAS